MSDSLPNGWEVCPLEQVARIVRGITFPTAAKRHEPQIGYVACLRTANVQFEVEWGDLWYVPREYVKNEDQYVRSGDVLISTANSYELVGKVAQVKSQCIEASLGAFISLLRAEPGVHAAYFYYLLSSESVQRAIREKASTTTNLSNVSGAKLKELQLPIAPSAEQTRIVEKLEELLSDLDAGVAELKAAQRKLAQYRQSLLKAAVEGALTQDWRARNAPRETGAELLQRILRERRARWEQKQLAKFAEQGKTPPKDWRGKYPEPMAPDTAGLPELPEGWVWASVEQVTTDEAYALAIGPFGSDLVVSDYRDEGVPLVFVRNIRSRTYGGSATKFVTPQKAEELRAHHVAAGDVLVTKMGEPPGDADVYPSGQPIAVITADCIKIRPRLEMIDAHYLASVINSPLGARQIKPMTQGVAQKKVSLGRFSSLAIPLPPKSEQDEIVVLLQSAFAAIQDQQNAVERGLQQAAAQRKNLLRAAFAGQLVPQDPRDEPASELLARIRAARAGQDGKRAKPRGRKAKENA